MAWHGMHAAHVSPPVLIFGSTFHSVDEGGQTHFPHLNVSVTPRAGDALVWMNVDESGEPNPRSLHEGRPPARGEKLAINCWVSDRPFDTGEIEEIVLNEGDMIIYRGDLGHTGAEYDDENWRLHVYIDSPVIERAMDEDGSTLTVPF